MEMTNAEIKRSYEQATDKSEQVKILAELNACDADKIKMILGLPTKTRAKHGPPVKYSLDAFAKQYIELDGREDRTAKLMDMFNMPNIHAVYGMVNKCRRLGLLPAKPKRQKEENEKV